jgi:hypothetical protein
MVTVNDIYKKVFSNAKSAFWKEKAIVTYWKLCIIHVFLIKIVDTSPSWGP